jgi:hypothetical protein
MFLITLIVSRKYPNRAHVSMRPPGNGIFRYLARVQTILRYQPQGSRLAKDAAFLRAKPGGITGTARSNSLPNGHIRLNRGPIGILQAWATAVAIRADC